MIGHLKSFIEGRFRIAAQLYLGIGGAVTLTMIASLVGWFSFNRVGDIQERINKGSIPEMAAAFAVAQQSGTLVAVAPRLAAVSSQEDFSRVIANINEEQGIFETQLTALLQQGIDEERFEQIQSNGNALITNIKAIESTVTGSFVLSDRSEELRAQLIEVENAITRILVPAIDDQLFYTMLGYRNLNEAPDPREQHFSNAELNNFRHLSELQKNATIQIQLLASAFNNSDAALLEPLRERFEADVAKTDQNLAALGMEQVQLELAPVFKRLSALGLGENGGFALRARELALNDSQQVLLGMNRDLAIDLVSEVESLVRTSRDRAREATETSAQVILTGRSLLLALNILSIVGAILIAWLLIGQILLRRLEKLSDRMRSMAGGDLEVKIDIAGSDEVADMAQALEVFRRNALEVQRLNLVEKLAEELSSKNSELEKVLVDLQRAQDQIVMREKLAALGELTAGVAHEIKNPLNFVGNFSAVSEELLGELLEVVEENKDKFDEDKLEIIQYTCSDLTENLQSIRKHGDRANRIIHDMLMMGGGTGEKYFTDLNALLTEHAQLAYHSVKASDPEFRLDIREELDPNISQIEVVPQDIGRVFVNMVTNACYATNERRQEAIINAKQAPDSPQDAAVTPYIPILRLTTKQTEDHIEIHVRDNGKGMPPEVIAKIFNPFFTTKPTDKGTGLGLALSNDIIREHRGSIQVNSKPDEFTEMTIRIPKDPVVAELNKESSDQATATQTEVVEAPDTESQALSS